MDIAEGTEVLTRAGACPCALHTNPPVSLRGTHVGFASLPHAQPDWMQVLITSGFQWDLWLR